MKTEYFWVVFNSDLFLVPMHNLAGYIVKFTDYKKFTDYTDYKKCWKWGLGNKKFVVVFCFLKNDAFLTLKLKLLWVNMGSW